MSNVEDAVEQFVFVGMFEAGDELLEAKQRLQLPLDPLLQRHGVQILLHHDHAETPQPATSYRSARKFRKPGSRMRGTRG